MSCTLTLLLGISLGSPEEIQEYRLFAGPAEDDLAWVVLEAGKLGKDAQAAVLLRDGNPTPVQLLDAVGAAPGEGKKAVWIVPELKKGETVSWTLKVLQKKDSAVAAGGFALKQLPEGAIEVDFGGKLFTKLIAGPDARKPYLYPILLDGVHLTRHYPMEEFPGEDKDHVHQRSFWFTHGDVNGVDFWSESAKAGKIVQKDARAAGGEVFGAIAATSEWLAPDGKKILDDGRSYLFYDLGPAGRMIDLELTLRASEGPVTFGDTKEGTFGIRLAESMKETKGGRIVNSRGEVGMKNAWGKPAEWIDYTGKIGEKTYGIAILDHPSSFRHPTTWHVRNYGLFAANPFGLKDFTGDKKKDGSHRLEKGSAISFRYRVLFHPGGAEEARIAAAWRAFARPPQVRSERIR